MTVNKDLRNSEIFKQVDQFFKKYISIFSPVLEIKSNSYDNNNKIYHDKKKFGKNRNCQIHFFNFLYLENVSCLSTMKFRQQFAVHTMELIRQILRNSLQIVCKKYCLQFMNTKVVVLYFFVLQSLFHRPANFGAKIHMITA